MEIPYRKKRVLDRWSFVHIKNIAGDDQATLMDHQNSANITYTFRFYVCLRLRDHDWCFTADDNSSCHRLAPSFSKRGHVAYVNPLDAKLFFAKLL